MKLNIGGVDRILRIAIGLVLILLAATGVIGLWGWLGLVLVATASVRWCPLYTLLGVHTGVK
jgi:hypothetical protein